MSDYDPFAIVPSQHPDDQEAVQRKEMLVAIAKVQNFLEDSDYVHAKSLVNALDEIYHYIQEQDY